jgi:hypothetical protein
MPNIIRIKDLEIEDNLVGDESIPIDREDYGQNAKRIHLSVFNQYVTGITWNYVSGFTAGTSGSDGTSGTDGISGSSGSSGISGTDGTSGSSGTNGTDGTSGSSGSSGSSGIGDRYRTFSTDTMTIQTGYLSFSAETYLAYSPAQSILISSGVTDYMLGSVVSYDPLTGAFVVFIDSVSGLSNVFDYWIVNLGGASGGDGSSGTNGTSGSSGTNGTSGSSGTNGTSGSSGTNGINGSSGQDFPFYIQISGISHAVNSGDTIVFDNGCGINISTGTTGSNFKVTFGTDTNWPIVSVDTEAEFIAAFDYIHANPCYNGGTILVATSIQLSTGHTIDHSGIIVEGLNTTIAFGDSTGATTTPYIITVIGDSFEYRNITLDGICSFNPGPPFTQVGRRGTTVSGNTLFEFNTVVNPIFYNVSWQDIICKTTLTPILKFNNLTSFASLTMIDNYVATRSSDPTKIYDYFYINLNGSFTNFTFFCYQHSGDAGVNNTDILAVESGYTESSKFYFYGSSPSSSFGFDIISDGSAIVSGYTSADFNYINSIKHPFIINRLSGTPSADDYFLFSDTSYGGYLRKGLIGDLSGGTGSGSSGTNGTSGSSGSSGTGTNGTSGSSGSSGTGTNGTSGSSGSSGTGTNGTSGSSGSSGTGTNGTSGSSGSSGVGAGGLFTWIIDTPEVGGIPGPRLRNSVTVTRLDSFVTSGITASPSVAFNIEERTTIGISGTVILSTPMLSVLSGATTSSFSDPNLAADNWLWVDVQSVTNLPEKLVITLSS